MTDPDSPKAQELFSNVFHVSAGDRGPMYYCQQWGREFGIQKQPLPDLKKIPEFFPNFDFPVPSSDIGDKNTIASNKSGNSKTSGSGFEQNTQIEFCFQVCVPRAVRRHRNWKANAGNGHGQIFKNLLINLFVPALSGQKKRENMTAKTGNGNSKISGSGFLGNFGSGFPVAILLWSSDVVPLYFWLFLVLLLFHYAFIVCLFFAGLFDEVARNCLIILAMFLWLLFRQMLSSRHAFYFF
jgi:hypothetical protein